jgi:hypothetical protein
MPFRAPHDRTGNLPLFPGIFPDQIAPIVRYGPGGERELFMARWGMPGPPQVGGAPITNIRNVSSPHWRGWLGKRNRCVVRATSFCEYADTKPRKTPTWFAIDEGRPLFAFAAYGRPGAACEAPRAHRSRASMRRVPVRNDWLSLRKEAWCRCQASRDKRLTQSPLRLMADPGLVLVRARIVRASRMRERVGS